MLPALASAAKWDSQWMQNMYVADFPMGMQSLHCISPHTIETCGGGEKKNPHLQEKPSEGGPTNNQIGKSEAGKHSSPVQEHPLYQRMLALPIS